MADRVMKVNAFTTFDLLEGAVEGHGFAESAFATLDVRTEDGRVALELELDNTELDAVPAHADRVTLSADEADRLAAELREAATRAGES